MSAIITWQMPAAQASFGTLQIPQITVQGSIVPYVEGISLSSGANTIAVPTSSVGFAFTPPSSNTATLTLKGVSGDTGMSMPKATSFFYAFDPTNLPTNIVITAGAGVNNCEIIFF